MQFTSTIIVALLLAVSTTTTVTAAPTSSNLRGGRPLPQEQKLSGPAPASSVVFNTALEDAVITATTSTLGVSLPVMGTAETAAPSSVYPAIGTAETAAPSSVYPAMGTAETAAPSSLGVALPAMGTAETAVPSSLYSIPDAVITAAPSSSGISLQAMGTAETAAPSSLKVSLPTMGKAETALFPKDDRFLSAGCPNRGFCCPGNDQPSPASFCKAGCGDKQYNTCCAKYPTDPYDPSRDFPLYFYCN